MNVHRSWSAEMKDQTRHICKQRFHETCLQRRLISGAGQVARKKQHLIASFLRQVSSSRQRMPKCDWSGNSNDRRNGIPRRPKTSDFSEVFHGTEESAYSQDSSETCGAAEPWNYDPSMEVPLSPNEKGKQVPREFMIAVDYSPVSRSAIVC